jgi:hypothetical protein
VGRLRLIFASLLGVGAALLLVAGAGARANPYGHVTELHAAGTGQFFGSPVALSANATTALVGDPARPKGAVWVFRRAIGGAWSVLARLPGGDFFGWAVALSGDGRTAVVGAPYVDNRNGGAWVYSNRGAASGSVRD